MIMPITARPSAPMPYWRSRKMLRNASTPTRPNPSTPMPRIWRLKVGMVSSRVTASRKFIPDGAPVTDRVAPAMPRTIWFSGSFRRRLAMRAMTDGMVSTGKAQRQTSSVSPATKAMAKASAGPSSAPSGLAALWMARTRFQAFGG